MRQAPGCAGWHCDQGLLNSPLAKGLYKLRRRELCESFDHLDASDLPAVHNELEFAEAIVDEGRS